MSKLVFNEQSVELMKLGTNIEGKTEYNVKVNGKPQPYFRVYISEADKDLGERYNRVQVFYKEIGLHSDIFKGEEIDLDLMIDIYKVIKSKK